VKNINLVEVGSGLEREFFWSGNRWKLEGVIRSVVLMCTLGMELEALQCHGILLRVLCYGENVAAGAALDAKISTDQQ
jgi:hypothetical protein